MANLKKTNCYFLASCTIGVVLSCYALLVELRKEEDEDYKAFCDLNEYVSCTKAFSSKYGKGFGIIAPFFGEDSILNQPNSVGGIIFYTLLALLSFSKNKVAVKFQIALCIISNFLSVYLAYILYFILQDFCIVCVSTYMVNAFNLLLSILKWNIITKEISLKFKVSQQKEK